MGHSDAWRDCEWLATQILTWMFADERPSEIFHFSLVGSRVDLAALVSPVGGGKGERSLSFTFEIPNTNVNSIDSDRPDLNRLLRNMLHANRYLQIVRGNSGVRLKKPLSMRREIRKLIKSAREQKTEEACPIPAGHLPLVIAKRTSVEDLTVQMVVALSQWGLIEITENDRQAIVEYLCNLFRNPSRFVAAAEEAISYIFTNWIFPEHWLALKKYAKHAVWGIYAQAVRDWAKTKHNSNNGLRSQEDWAEQQQEKMKRGMKPAETRRDYLSVSELADISNVSRQRIYEMIKAKKLEAVKIGMSLRVEASVVEQFYNEANQRRDAKNFKSQLLAAGMAKEALRKRIYRLRRKHGPDFDITKQLKANLWGRAQKKQYPGLHHDVQQN